MWKFMMKGFPTIKDFLYTIEGEKVKPKDISNSEWNKMNKKGNCIH